jgi:signal transduction histidine kinase/DNA-binding NarL/FixJ family response regulator
MAAAEDRETTEGVEAGVVSNFESAMAVEMLESQALRTRALGLVFGAATLFLSVLGIWFYGRYGIAKASAPLTALAVVAAIAVFEIGMLRMIRRKIRRGAPVPVWRWYANACVEITAMSVVILLVQGVLSNPVYALATPPLLAYFLFIILSTLYLDLKLSLFTGGLAAAEYLGIVLYTFDAYGPDAAQDPVFMTPGLYVGKTAILLLAGLSAGFVAREFSRRQRLSLAAVEERNREHRANALKSQFLADMSHEIRTPLNAVIGHAQLLQTDPDITADQRRAIEAIRVGGRHLLAVINDVLDLSKIEAGGEALTVTHFDLSALLRDLTLVFAARTAEKRLTWIFDMPPGTGNVLGDEGKLRQVLTNLLGNAVKFTAEGHVALHVTSPSGGIYVFEVEDTGPGIAADRQAEIFDPFAQDVQGRIQGGTGLGLAIARRYVAMMGGELSMTSALGQGSRFRFTLSLPTAGTDTITPPAAHLPRSLAAGQTVRAAVVDDLAENREILSRMLMRLGASVQEGVSGDEAVALATGGAIDILFLDIRMPGMDGIEAMRRAKANGVGGLKIVAVSASALAHERDSYLSAGFDEFLSKPVQLTVLQDCLVRLLGVAFDTAPQAIPPVAAPAPAVPGALHRSLRDAASRHNITDLKRHLTALEALGDEERALAARLRGHCATYDMQAIGRLLEDLAHD